MIAANCCSRPRWPPAEAGTTLLTSHTVSGPVLDTAGRVVGVMATVGPDRQPQEFPGVAGDRGRRRVRPLRPRAWPGQAGGPAHRRRRAPVLPLPARHDDDYLD